MKTDCHFSPRLLWEYEEGLLDERRRLEVERHLSACEVCRARTTMDRDLFSKLRNQRPLAAPESARPPKWEAKPAPGWAARWRWPVTVAGVAVLAFVAFGVFRIAGDHGPVSTGLESAAAAGHQEPPQVAPLPTQQRDDRPKQVPRSEAPRQGAAEPKQALERAGTRAAEPGVGGKMTLGGDEELPQPMSEKRSERPEKAETRPSPPGTRAAPPQGGQEGFERFGGLGAGAGGGFRGAADKAQAQAVVTALTDDGKVLAVAEMDAANRVSIREQDGTTVTFDLGTERKWSGRPAYLDRTITLSETGSLGMLSKQISHQASVPVEVTDVAKEQLVTVYLSEVQLGLALANIALASETEWKAEQDRVVISPLFAHASMAKAGVGAQEQVQRNRVLPQQLREGNLMLQQSRGMDAVCPWCGRPHFGPLWRYCPFCGQPLQGKP